MLQVEAIVAEKLYAGSRSRPAEKFALLDKITITINMADTLVVLDNVLCFLLARYGKTAIKQLKAAVLDFYSTEDICCAKENVLCAVESLKSEINLPHIPLRRDGELRASKSLDDIVTVLTILDENLSLIVYLNTSLILLILCRQLEYMMAISYQ